MKVSAAVLSTFGEAPKWTDLELDRPGRGEVLIKVHAAGLCHSDLSVIDGSRPRPLPMALGHEVAGEVLAVGDGRTHMPIGSHVVATFVPSCGSCLPCQEGRPALCEPGAAANAAGHLLTGARKLSTSAGEPIHHHLGISGFADHAVLSSRSIVPVAPSLPWEIAALFGCAVLTGVGAVVNAAHVRPGESVAVFGLGGVGLAALIGAAAAGAWPIVAIDPVPAKTALALELGATHAIPPDGDTEAYIRRVTDGGVDHAIETVGRTAALEQAYASTRRGGTTTTVGLPHPEAQIHLPGVSLTAEERRLQGSYLGSCVPARDIPRFIALYQAGRLPVDRLLTHRLHPSELEQGFTRMARGDGIRQTVVFA